MDFFNYGALASDALNKVDHGSDKIRRPLAQLDPQRGLAIAGSSPKRRRDRRHSATGIAFLVKQGALQLLNFAWPRHEVCGWLGGHHRRAFLLALTSQSSEERFPLFGNGGVDYVS
jgi:hypothetical protein